MRDKTKNLAIRHTVHQMLMAYVRRTANMSAVDAGTEAVSQWLERQARKEAKEAGG